MKSAKPLRDRKFACDKCDKKFFTPKDLKRHYNTHLGLRNYACPSCHTRFGRKDHLTRHAKKSCSAAKPKAQRHTKRARNASKPKVQAPAQQTNNRQLENHSQHRHQPSQQHLSEQQNQQTHQHLSQQHLNHHTHFGPTTLANNYQQNQQHHYITAIHLQTPQQPPLQLPTVSSLPPHATHSQHIQQPQPFGNSDEDYYWSNQNQPTTYYDNYDQWSYPLTDYGS